MMDDGFIPGFNVDGKMANVLQIHSKKGSAEDLARKVNGTAPSEGNPWKVVEVEITYSL